MEHFAAYFCHNIDKHHIIKEEPVEPVVMGSNLAIQATLTVKQDEVKELALQKIDPCFRVKNPIIKRLLKYSM